MSKGEEAKTSILNYVENFIDKRDNELRTTVGDDEEAHATRGVDRDKIVITSGEGDYQREPIVSIFCLEIFTHFSQILNYLDVLMEFTIY
jgi:hypothetical protein